MVRFPTELTSRYSLLHCLTGLAGVFRLEKGRRQGRWIGYETLKWQEEVIDDIESLLDVIREGYSAPPLEIRHSGENQL
jgi:hypothetical protein